jgi:hypothetical protein
MQPEYPIDANITLTMWACSRREIGVVERKFVADCGNKIILRLSQSSKILSILPESPKYHSCLKCQEKIEFVKNLISKS